MNKVVIIALSIVMYIASLTIINDVRNKTSKLFKSVNDSYKRMFQKIGKLLRFLFSIIIILVFFQVMAKSYLNVVEITNEAISIRTFSLTFVLTFITFVFFYYLFGLPIMVIGFIEKFINEIKNIDISMKFLISFMILIFYSFAFIFLKKEVTELAAFIFIGLFISYAINISLLIEVILNPFCYFITDKDEILNDKRQVLTVTMIATFILLILVIINLFLVVVMIWRIWPNSYYCSVPNVNISELDLFYYTVISFTTIGFGDIVPSISQSKIVAIFISFTSVLCLVIFIGSALSVKDKLHQNKML